LVQNITSGNPAWKAKEKRHLAFINELKAASFMPALSSTYQRLAAF
jgi:hypothetical protein